MVVEDKKKDKIAVTKDFKAMTGGNWSALNEEIAANFAKHDADHPPKQAKDPQADTRDRLTRLNTCIQEAIETKVPAKKRLNQIKRNVSDNTR